MPDADPHRTALWTGPPERPHRYRVEARGGTVRSEPGGGVEGRVYRATVDDPGHPEHGDVVALKLLIAPSPADIDVVTERLAPLTEAHDARLMRIRTTFVGTALTDEAEPDPQEFDVCCVVADWIEGTPLNDVAEAIDADTALDIVEDLARAVAVLHAIRSPAAPAGVVHRDLKTSNVRVRADGTPVVIDYGLARPVTDDASVVGTPGWLAPEVAAGRPGATAADVYGLGAIAHDLVTGAPPRRDGAAAATVAFRRALGESPTSGAVSEHLAALLELDPEDRPGDLSAWADELARVRRGGRPVRRRRPSRRVTLAAAALAGALAVAVAAAGGALSADPTSSDDRAGAPVAGRTARTEATTTTESPVTAPPGWVCDRTPALPDGPLGDQLRTAFAGVPKSCAGSVDALRDGVTLRTLDRVGEPDGVFVVSPTTPVVRLSPSQLTSWLEVLGRGQSDKSATFAGFPTSVTRDAATGLDLIELTAGGLLVAPPDGAQGFWVPTQVRDLWNRTGGLTGELGAPTSPVFLTGVTLRLEFQRGWMEAPAKSGLGGSAAWLQITPDDITVHTVDPQAELAAIGPIADRVLRQANGTSWYVDASGIRHWIPDGPTWGCLQANEKVVPLDVPGYAVDAVPRGDRARCPR